MQKILPMLIRNGIMAVVFWYAFDKIGNPWTFWLIVLLYLGHESNAMRLDLRPVGK